MTALRSLLLLVALGMPALAEKPEKLPVALGSWKGPHAGGFKSALRQAMSKECAFVKPNKARAVIDGEVEEKDKKKFTVRVIVKSAKSGEVVEQREFNFNKPNPSQGQASRMGREVTDIARRAPTDS